MLVASTAGAEDDGVLLWTAQQTRNNPASYGFTFLDSNVPDLTSYSPANGPASGGDELVIEFKNYCDEHPLSGYGVQFSTSTTPVTGIVLDVDFRETTSDTARECITVVTVQTPSVSDTLTSKVTLVPNGVTSKGFTFAYDFQAFLLAEPAVTQAVLGSTPRFMLALSNLRNTTGTLCHGNGCNSPASCTITVVYGGQTVTLLNQPASCVNGVCKKIGIQLPTLYDAGTFEIEVCSSYGECAYFDFTVFEYDCDEFCRDPSRELILNQDLIADSPPESDTCSLKYCMEHRVRQPAFISVSSLVCPYNQNCEIQMKLTQVTAERLSEDTYELSRQLSIQFSGVSASSITKVSQSQCAVGKALEKSCDSVILKVVTPVMDSSDLSADVEVIGYDDQIGGFRGMLTAAKLKSANDLGLQKGFKFKPVATGSIILDSVTSASADHKATLILSNFPDDFGGTSAVSVRFDSISVTPSTVKVDDALGAEVMADVPLFSCQQEFCVVNCSLSVLATDSEPAKETSFTYSYIGVLPPAVENFSPLRGSSR